MAAELVIEASGELARHQRLLGSEVLIGSAPDCPVFLSGLFVSRRHAELRIVEGTWHVVDLDSKNGVRLNGARIEPRQARPLRNRDRLEVPGYTLTFCTPDETGETRDLGDLRSNTGGRVTVDPLQHSLFVDGRRVRLELSRTEFALLAHLAQAGPRVCGRQELLERVWGVYADGTPKADDGMLYGLVHSVRERLAAAELPNLIRNVRGVGYVISMEPGIDE